MKAYYSAECSVAQWALQRVVHWVDLSVGLKADYSDEHWAGCSVVRLVFQLVDKTDDQKALLLAEHLVYS